MRFATSAGCSLSRAEHAGDFPKISFILRSPPLARGSSWQRGRKKVYGKLCMGYRKPRYNYRSPFLNYRSPFFNYRTPLFELLPTPFQLPFLYKNFIIIRRIHNNIKGFRDIGIDRGPCTAGEKCVTRVRAGAHV